ncbi:hypothetical protein AGMMS49991_05080 [Spirochaetia bacterium]|nr:hypothetical protein AGMMS49991_05080 [Spirochaetia bacterium]
MKRKIPCLCENTFTVEAPEEIDLDAECRYLDEILSGAFMNFTCTSCGKKHKPEFPITVLWPSRDLRFEVLPELERMSFYHEKKERDRNVKTETLIGYPELADRLQVIRDGLEPAAVEALKYYLLLKAEETYPDEDITIWYHSGPQENAGTLEFHLQGLKENSVAVTRVPFTVYEKTLADYQKHPRGELFSSLRFRTYLSVQNMMSAKGVSLDIQENAK